MAATTGTLPARTIAVDPAFAYYDRPWDKTFDAIHAEGFDGIHIVDTGWDPTTWTTKLVNIAGEARKAGISPGLRIHPGTDHDLYLSHPEWRQKTLDGLDGRQDWRTYLCPNNEEFMNAYCAKLEKAVRASQVDEIQLAEPWLEVWGGPDDKDGNLRPKYACVCSHCVEKFHHETGADAREMLTSRTSSFYFRKPANSLLYGKWVTFRCQTVLRMTQKLFDAAERGRPGIRRNLMILSDARVEPGKSREYQAVDLDLLLRETKPDVVTIQDAWQDWTQAKLSPSFIEEYGQYYAPKIKALSSETILMSHVDIGSLPVSKRSREWILNFEHDSKAAGFRIPSYYEWSLSVMAEPKSSGN